MILFHKGRTREHFTCTFFIWYRVLVRMSDITTTIQLQLQQQLQVRCCFFLSSSFNLMGWCDRKRQRERTSHTWNTVCFPFFPSNLCVRVSAIKQNWNSQNYSLKTAPNTCVHSSRVRWLVRSINVLFWWSNANHVWGKVYI